MPRHFSGAMKHQLNQAHSRNAQSMPERERHIKHVGLCVECTHYKKHAKSYWNKLIIESELAELRIVFIAYSEYTASATVQAHH